MTNKSKNPAATSKDAVAALTPRLIGARDFARITGLSRSGAYKLISTGTITPIHVGKRLLIPIEEVDKLIEAAKSGAISVKGGVA